MTLTKVNKVILQLFVLSMVVHSCHGGCDFFDMHAKDNKLMEGTDWICTPPSSDNGQNGMPFL